MTERGERVRALALAYVEETRRWNAEQAAFIERVGEYVEPPRDGPRVKFDWTFELLFNPDAEQGPSTAGLELLILDLADALGDRCAKGDRSNPDDWDDWARQVTTSGTEALAIAVEEDYGLDEVVESLVREAETIEREREREG